MFLSIFDIFKIGIGPSSSHTVGPMVAARRFLDGLGEQARGRITVTLHGSLAFTGRGHATDQAVALGLAGESPETVDPDRVEPILTRLAEEKCLADAGRPRLLFDPAADVLFDYGPPLTGHANGMVFRLWEESASAVREETYYSVGGGFVATAAELAQLQSGRGGSSSYGVPFPFATAGQMLEMGEAAGLTIAAMKRANEEARRPEGGLDDGIDRVVGAMNACMDRGLTQSGTLPGGLKIKRRARAIHQQLMAESGSNMLQPHRLMDWLGVYAMAVNEENAAGGRVVTAPTNGAAGVIPAVLRYYTHHCLGADEANVRDFLLSAAAIGGIIKHNASISGAEVGCQGEVGSAAAMAAAGLAAALGGTNAQVENAAEIALEHHLGMTCDPIGGLVQVPCIERNALGAVKAVTAASLALRGDGSHFVPLDDCIETMRQTGRDMSDKYKETSRGGLAVNVVAC
ncbi:L-serine ammonia-lyase [Faunimonas sp. B44]|uniref:L-serine ammonia-lyase n=1 Tax=Faunimonas sp. B44 TaxID=3461493 RepID=UPI004043A3B1